MLSPYLNPRNLTGAFASEKLTGGIRSIYGDLDKRGEKTIGGYSFRTILNTTKSLTDSVAGILGVNSPYYKIGEIEEGTDTPEAVMASYGFVGGSLFRAVSSLSRNNIQDGVIIDCLGDVESTMSVKFTENPLFYETTASIDSRIRQPIKLRATVGVSNYRTDDGIGDVAGLVSSLDPTGILGTLSKQLLYGGLTRAQYALARLKNLMETGRPFTVYTPHGYYENMLIQSLTPRTTESTMDMLLCDIVFMEAILYKPYYNQTSASGVKEAARAKMTKDSSGNVAMEKADQIAKTKG